MEGIDTKKDRTRFLEEQNELLAKENDELKQGAIDSVKLIQSSDELQKDLEYLSSQLADKAVIIRKLLEDNTLLN